MPLAGLADPVDPWQRIQVKEEVEVCNIQSDFIENLL